MNRETAFIKIKKYCAYQERSQQEVRDKLYEYGLHRADVENLIIELIQENFINESRFAESFARGKFRIKHWGRIKIRMALQQKRVSPRCISDALNALDQMEYSKTLRHIIDEKSSSTKARNKLQRNYQVAQYAISRGFEPDLVWNIIRETE